MQSIANAVDAALSAACTVAIRGNHRRAEERQCNMSSAQRLTRLFGIETQTCERCCGFAVSNGSAPRRQSEHWAVLVDMEYAWIVDRAREISPEATSEAVPTAARSTSVHTSPERSSAWPSGPSVTPKRFADA